LRTPTAGLGSFQSVTPGKQPSMADLENTNANRRLRVLVVDDFETMHQAVTGCLEVLAGVDVVGTALNGREALDKMPLLTPDLLIVDLQMPVMDGFQLMQHVRREYPKAKMVAISGHASAAIEREALAAGAHAFVSKSSLPEGLVAKVRALLLS